MSKTRLSELPQDNEFYRKHYHKLIIALIVCIIIMLIVVIALLYEIHHRPLPQFFAKAPNGLSLKLVADEEPNLLQSTLIKWANKAAVTAYTFDWVNYDSQLGLARPYFTNSGWQSYVNSIQGVLNSVKQNKIFVNGVVSGPPVISNQGDLPGFGYAWRVQIPFLATYQSSETTSSNPYMVILTVVRVPTSTNPAGIGIGQFVMM